jgi:hypothetical protein
MEKLAVTAEPFTKVSIDAGKLHRHSTQEALEAFEDFIGAPESWTSEVVRYRIESEWQQDWRVEAGQWALFARTHGFADGLQKRLTGARRAPPEAINDPGHASLTQELAPVMFAHYLTGTGWKFGAWEPPPPEPKTDIDETLVAPTGEEVDFQVKAPDRPGKWMEEQLVVPGNGRVIKRQFLFLGEVDEWVRTALAKAAKQLPRKARRPQMIALCSQRQWPLGSSPRVIESTLLGSAVNIDGLVRIDHHAIDLEIAANPTTPLRRGECRDNWDHVGGVVMLDYRRGFHHNGHDNFDYLCTVILNPWAQPAARCHESWFPHARVLALRGEHFSWRPAVPDDTAHSVPVLYVPRSG